MIYSDKEYERAGTAKIEAIQKDFAENVSPRVYSRVANMWRRAYVAAGRPLVCACHSYEWLHRRGFGWCKLKDASADGDVRFFRYINANRRKRA